MSLSYHAMIRQIQILGYGSRPEDDSASAEHLTYMKFQKFFLNEYADKACSVPWDEVIRYQLLATHSTRSQQTHIEPTSVVGKIMERVERLLAAVMLIKEQNGSISHTISQLGYQPFFCLALSSYIARELMHSLWPQSVPMWSRCWRGKSGRLRHRFPSG